MIDFAIGVAFLVCLFGGCVWFKNQLCSPWHGPTGKGSSK
jgi:hypothetical protein